MTEKVPAINLKQTQTNDMKEEFSIYSLGTMNSKQNFSQQPKMSAVAGSYTILDKDNQKVTFLIQDAKSINEH